MSKSLDGVLTKKANKKETFTEEQVQDLAKCMDNDLGYLYFAKNLLFHKLMKFQKNLHRRILIMT